MKETDVLIIGAGLGGLFTGALLAKEGLRVTLVEKNPTIGGGLQTFRRWGESFDTGMHVVGGMRPGGNIRAICQYLGILDEVRLRDVDDDCTDSLFFAEDQQTYRIAKGREGFVNSLSHYFPNQRQNIGRYVDAIGRLTDEVPLFHLKPQGDTLSLHSDEFMMPADAADILFTTGSTGKPKAVVWGNDTIVANAENLIAGQGFTPGLNFVVSGPLNHIGSLSKIQATLIAGATLWIADGLRDINGFYDMMERCEGKVATFLVPASIRILLQLGRERLGRLADKVAFIETGAAPIAQTEMLALCATLPKSRLYNTYASTETGIVASYDFNDGHCEAGCVGRVLKNALLRVDDDGTLACGGRSIMLGYADDETLTSETLRGGFVHTHDVGRVGSDGMLRLAGRNDDIINVGGYKVNPAEVEEAAMGDNQVADCVCVGVAHPVTGHALKLWVVTANGRPLDKRALALALRSKLENHQVPQLYEQTESIRRTFNGKLDRESYKAAQPSQKD